MINFDDFNASQAIEIVKRTDAGRLRTHLELIHKAAQNGLCSIKVNEMLTEYTIGELQKRGFRYYSCASFQDGPDFVYGYISW